MYVEIKNNKLLSWCENPYLDYVYVDIDYATFEPEKYEVIDGVLTDISDTPEYIAEQEAKAKAEKNAEIIAELDRISLKAVRAILNPTEVKDEIKGETWAEYYKKELDALRAGLEE